MHPHRLHALTSARFFAAAAIVIGHTHPRFGSFGLAFTPLNQGVSFFFVLSGFILHYNYKSFASVDHVKRFIVARFARIWPVHIVCIGLFFVILPSELWYLPYPGPTLGTLLLSNILLVQSWVPITEFYLSLNGVAWSISNELFFYLCLPLILVLVRSMRVPLLISATLVLLFCFVTDTNNISSTYGPGLTAYGLIYANPLVRLFEFVIGVAAARLFMDKRLPVGGTLLEILALFAIVVFMILCPVIASSPWFVGLVGSAFSFWFLNCGGVLFFAFLIYALAENRGIISQALSAKWMVFLGEISFSIYMTHQILNRAWGMLPVTQWPIPIQAALFWIILIAISSLMYLLVETRFRTIIVRSYGRWSDRKQVDQS